MIFPTPFSGATDQQEGEPLQLNDRKALLIISFTFFFLLSHIRSNIVSSKKEWKWRIKPFCLSWHMVIGCPHSFLSLSSLLITHHKGMNTLISRSMVKYLFCFVFSCLFKILCLIPIPGWLEHNKNFGQRGVARDPHRCCFRVLISVPCRQCLGFAHYLWCCCFVHRHICYRLCRGSTTTTLISLEDNDVACDLFLRARRGSMWWYSYSYSVVIKSTRSLLVLHL